MNIGIKKLDYFILRSFIGPFVITFFVVLFTLTLQFYWLYMDELIGKGFGVWVTLKLMAYMSTTMVPMALPLGILLASIMTFGSLGESFELVAIKSAGISLFRFMRPMVLFIAFISVLAFLFNNYVIPVASLKSYSLLYDMRNQKPAMNIKEGVFNKDIDGFQIRVGKKGKDGQHIEDVLIYDHTSGRGNDKVVVAKKGRMYPSKDKRSLIFELHDGWRYEEGDAKDKAAQTRMHFGKWYKVFDLSKFTFTRTKEELFKNNHEMMNVGQLNKVIDSAQQKISNAQSDIERYLQPYFTIYQNKEKDTLLRKQLQGNKVERLSYRKSFYDLISDSAKVQVAATVESNVRNTKRLITIVRTDNDLKGQNMVQFKIAWHERFTLSFACMVLFLIGAPLGAIIRKGGLGMPVIIAIGFFIVYFIISSTGKKLAQQTAVSPWYGMWMATLVLMPIALVMMIAARNDASVFNKEWYVRMWSKIRGIFVK